MNNNNVIARRARARRGNPVLPRRFWMASLALVITFTFLATLPARAQDITTGLVGHWTLDETSGTTAADSSGNGNNGTMEGGLDAGSNSISGRIGAALTFDGADDFIDVGTSLPTNLDSGFTLSAWVKWTRGSPQVDEEAIIARWHNTVESEKMYLLRWDSQASSLEFYTQDGTPRSLEGTTDTDISDGEWHHVVGLFDGSTMYLYLDGVQSATTLSTDGTLQSSATQTDIGADTRDGTTVRDEFQGYIDDVRIYNRALTTEDIAALYAARAPGHLQYNTDARVLEYFDGEQWIAAGRKTYVPDAVNFDSATSLDQQNASWAAASKKLTGSVWFRKINAGTQERIISNGDILNITIPTDGRFRIRTNGDELYVESSAGLDDGQWHHALFSFDLSDPNRRHLYIDDSSDLAVINGYADTAISFSSVSDTYIGIGSGGGVKFVGDMADFWLVPGVYIDLSVEANRRKFITEDGLPVYLGADGSGPTGSQPVFFLTGDTEGWHINKGTGGGFTENGALNDAATEPGAVFPGWAQIGNGLNVSGMGRPAMAKLSSTMVAFIDATNDELRTYSWDGSDWTQIGNGLSITGIGNAALAVLDGNTVAFADASLENLETYRWNGSSWAKVGNSLNITGTGAPALTALDSNTVAYIDISGAELRTYGWDGSNWSQVGNGFSIAGVGITGLVTLNGNTIAFVDGTIEELRTYSWDGSNWAQVGNGLAITGNSNPALAALGNATVVFADWGLDELRTFRWDGSNWAQIGSAVAVAGSGSPALAALNESAIAFIDDANMNLRTYGFGYCADPVRAQGTIIYNESSNVMQFCDGENWRAMGPVPGDGGGGCSDPTRGTGSMIYNADFNVMQYCDGANWIYVGSEPRCEDGAGAICEDGAVYAGMSPDGDVPMYTTRCDRGQTWDGASCTGTRTATPWNNGNSSNFTTTGITDTVTGEANTTALVAADADSTGTFESHQAAKYCDDLEALGYTDWYLPASGELDIVVANRAAIGGFAPNFSNYWSSSEFSVSMARVAIISMGGGAAGKGNSLGYYVRCVRK